MPLPEYFFRATPVYRGRLFRRTRTILRLASASPGEATDRERGVLAQQAYRLLLAPGRVQITANAAPGLFYGVQTLVQLLKPQRGSLWLPEGEIVDWPDLEMRVIY